MFPNVLPLLPLGHNSRSLWETVAKMCENYWPDIGILFKIIGFHLVQWETVAKVCENGWMRYRKFITVISLSARCLWRFPLELEV